MGIVSILRLTDIQKQAKIIFYFHAVFNRRAIRANCLKKANMDKPKLCVFIDEAHLIFDEASKELLDQLETTIKLIRS